MPNPVTVLNVTYPSQARACADLSVKPKDVCAYASYHRVPWEQALLHVFRRRARPEPVTESPSSGKEPWSHRDEVVMATWYPSEGIAVKARLSRPRGDRAIMLKAQKMGLVKPMTRQAWTSQDETVLRRYYPVFGADFCKTLLHRTARSVSNKASMMNLVCAPQDKPYHFMEAYVSADGIRYFWLYCGLTARLALLSAEQLADYISGRSQTVLQDNLVPSFIHVPKSMQQAIRRLRRRLAGTPAAQPVH